MRRGAVLLTLGLLAAVVVPKALGLRVTDKTVAARRSFKARYETALADPQLRASLLNSQRSWQRQRTAAFETYFSRTGRDFDTMRHELAAVAVGLVTTPFHHGLRSHQGWLSSPEAVGAGRLYSEAAAARVALLADTPCSSDETGAG